MQNNALWVALIILVFVVSVAVSITIVAAVRWGQRRLCGQARDADAEADKPIRTPAWLWLLVFAVFCLFLWVEVRKPPAQRGAGGLLSPTLPVIVLVAPVVFVALVILYLFARGYDGAVRRAQKLADAGDVDGAISDLQELIETKGPTQTRVNVLGILLLKRDRFNEAAALFRKAEELGDFKGVCRMNLGVALIRGGRAEEAIPVIEEAARVGPKVPVMQCITSIHLARAMADLDRWEEARRYFVDAENTAGTLSKRNRDAMNDELEQVRVKLAGQPNAAEKPDQLEEV
jgi:Flp pilus assembly protein TadD